MPAAISGSKAAISSPISTADHADGQPDQRRHRRGDPAARPTSVPLPSIAFSPLRYPVQGDDLVLPLRFVAAANDPQYTHAQPGEQAQRRADPVAQRIVNQPDRLIAQRARLPRRARRMPAGYRWLRRRWSRTSRDNCGSAIERIASRGGVGVNDDRLRRELHHGRALTARSVLRAMPGSLARITVRRASKVGSLSIA